MHLTITARRFNLEDDMRDYIGRKIVKLRRFYDGIIDLEIVLGWEKLMRYTEFRINVSHKQIIIKESSEEIRTSFDLALERAERQLKRYRAKSRTITRRSA